MTAPPHVSTTKPLQNQPDWSSAQRRLAIFPCCLSPHASVCLGWAHLRNHAPPVQPSLSNHLPMSCILSMLVHEALQISLCCSLSCDALASRPGSSDELHR